MSTKFITPSNLTANKKTFTNGVITNNHSSVQANFKVKTGLAQMLKGGVIMDVVNVEQARIAEEAGAVAVMALERVPADIRKQGGVARMSDPKMIKEIKAAVTIPVMAKVRIGHFVEAQILEAINVDYIDESEVLTPADEQHHINKNNFKVPFVCGAKNLGEALRRITEGAAMIRTKGEAGTGNVVEAVKHMRTITNEIRKASVMNDEELYCYAKEIQAPYNLLKETAELKRLPVVNFSAGGLATPADAAMMMQLGCDGVFVGSGIFKSGDPAKRAKAIVQAVTYYNDPKVLANVSEDLGEPMVGINIETIPTHQLLAKRGCAFVLDHVVFLCFIASNYNLKTNFGRNDVFAVDTSSPRIANAQSRAFCEEGTYTTATPILYDSGKVVGIRTSAAILNAAPAGI
ncbi:12311_t:CDS:2 [Entrophospora sp. SA101]|nr:12311_t:CDS:2 [Entrophospora sp. SA101]CAJ0833187.1 12734_t:CDS:2 [Entrophospora sp. SA101]CAJ0916872.1 13040_t:CDS:2 [Entrophospora sp. SA101]CAJ0916875.1 13041_t:CDS:2 [Entrophospora sp. SA101]